MSRQSTPSARSWAAGRPGAAWAAEDPAAKATAAETPATRPTAPAIRSMNRLARMIRLFMKITRVARGNIISPVSFPRSQGVDPQLKVHAVEHTINRAYNRDRRSGRIHGKDSEVKSFRRLRQRGDYRRLDPVMRARGRPGRSTTPSRRPATVAVVRSPADARPLGDRAAGFEQ